MSHRSVPKALLLGAASTDVEQNRGNVQHVHQEISPGFFRCKAGSLILEWRSVDICACRGRLFDGLLPSVRPSDE